MVLGGGSNSSSFACFVINFGKMNVYTRNVFVMLYANVFVKRAGSHLSVTLRPNTLFKYFHVAMFPKSFNTKLLS